MATTTLSVQPLVLAYNNEVVCIENNEQTIERNISCFKIFKLKGPIDTNYLLNILFPPSEKNYYDLEVSDYNGQSAKVKFSFTDRTHADLITHLKNASEKVSDLSENGIFDWIVSDTVTFRTIYQNFDATAYQILGDNRSLEENDSTSTSSSSTADSQLYPIVDKKAIDRELEELSKRISSQTPLTNYDLERLFHKTVGRRDMTVTVNDVVCEYFSQLRGVISLISDEKLIEDGENPSTIIRTFANQLFKHSEYFINPGVIGEFVKDYKFIIIVTLWNIFNACHSIQVSCQKLLESDEKIKQIFLSKRTDFEDCLSKIDLILDDILEIISDELDREKYTTLQRRFGNFITAVETLMKLVMIIYNECNEQLKQLESQGKSLSTKLWTVGASIGLAAAAGALYFMSAKSEKGEDSEKIENGEKSEKGEKSENGEKIEKIEKREKVERRENIENSDPFGKYGKWAIGALAGTAVATMGAGYSTRSAMQDSIDRQTNILEQLKSILSDLEEWKKLSDKYVVYDLNNMNNNRSKLTEEFTRVRNQCKSLNEIFKVGEDDALRSKIESL